MNIKIIKYLILNLFFIFSFSNISTAQNYPVYKNLSSIAILDQESLFSDSEWGKKILSSVENMVNELAAENRSIESKLELEELRLTQIRKKVQKSEFDILAFEFDKKVKKIRREQSNKQQKINIFLNKNKEQFFEKVSPILLKYIGELGVEVLLNKDTVALASTGSNITQSAINRINEKLNN